MNKSLLERLLDYYQINESEYEKLIAPVSFANFYKGHQFDDIDKAVNLINNAISKKEKVIIYGDYDADGVMGTSIIVKMFQYLGYEVDYYIPNRYLDGYGLNNKKAQEYIDNKYNLLIAVDNGITAFEPIELLHNNGVKILIIDHHQNQDQVPVADAIIHPSYSHFGEVPSSAAFTAFIFSISVLNRVDKYLATLASISLISDMMPMLEYNRNLLRVVINEYKKGEFLAVDLLTDDEPFDETLIGMKIAPRINSIGRLCEDESINKIVKFFTTKDKDFILNYFDYIVETNDARKQISKIDVDELEVNPEEKAIIIKGDYKEGIIGLIANSIMSKYHVPVVVFTKSSDGSLKGSARAPEGFNVVEAFNSLNDILLSNGGHALAGGCSLNEGKFEKFKTRFIEIAKATEIKKVEPKSIELGISELSLENYQLITSFGPFGENWAAPIFKIKHIKVSTLTYSRDHNHIITTIGNRQKLVYFNYPKEEFDRCSYVDVYGSIKQKSFKGFVYLEFGIKDYIPSN